MPGSSLERQLTYFRREASELGAKLVRLQEEQHRAALEVQRCRLVLRLAYEITRLGGEAATPDLLPLQVLEAIVEATHCRTAVLLREVRPGEQAFTVVASVGLNPPERRREHLRLGAVPAFLFTTSMGREGTPEGAVTRFLGQPHALWAWDADSGYALAIGDAVDRNATRPFESGDQDLIQTALMLFLSGIERSAARWMASQRQDAGPEGASAGNEAGVAAIDLADIDHGIEGGEALRDKLREGGRILDVAVIERRGADGPRWVGYLKASWERDWRVLRSYRGRSDRTYRDIGLLLRFLRDEVGFARAVPVYAPDSPDLARIPGIALREQRQAASSQDGTGAEDDKGLRAVS